MNTVWSKYIQDDPTSLVQTGPAVSNATSVAYGIGGDSCTEVVSSAWQFCDYASGPWTALKSGLGIQYARIVVPWDSMGTYSTSAEACVYNQNSQGQWNEVDSHGNSWAGDLIEFVAAAQDDGLTPVISIGSGRAAGGDPVWPDASSANGVWSTGDQQYMCGFYEMVSVLKLFVTLPNPAYWEVYNEPDNFQYNASTGLYNAPNIPSGVAANYFIDAYVSDHWSLGRQDKLIAGAFDYGSVDTNNSCCAYMTNYLESLLTNVRVWTFAAPDAVSGHPYNDPTRSGACNCTSTVGTTDIVNYASFFFGTSEPVWLTETGVWLNDATGGWGGDDNGNALNQAYGALGFKNLANVSSQIKAVFWFEFETYTGDTFDSALVGITNPDSTQSGAYNPGAGEWGVPRPSLCVLAYGDSPQAATTDPNCDFSLSPNNPLRAWEG